MEQVWLLSEKHRHPLDINASISTEPIADKNFLFVRRRIRESGLCVKLNFNTLYCGWYLGPEFLDETGVKADVFWTGI